jgi:hypothetical protein
MSLTTKDLNPAYFTGGSSSCETVRIRVFFVYVIYISSYSIKDNQYLLNMFIAFLY